MTRRSRGQRPQGRSWVRWLGAAGLAVCGALVAAASGAPGASAAARNVEAWAAGEGVATVVHYDASGFSRTTGVLAGRVELEVHPAAGGFWWAKAAVEPWIPVDLAGSGEAPGGSVAVTEAYAGLRLPAADVYVGRVPLPLETARLTLPFTLTPHDEAGRRPGADGVRADVYLAWGRLQLAAVQAGGRWTPVAGWRRQLSGWEATGYVLWTEDGPAAGVGASGLAGSTVVYGELWTFTGKRGLRGGVGATGYLGDLLWTVELARAGFPMADGQGGASAPMLLAAAQLAYALPSGWAMVADAAVALDEEASAAASLQAEPQPATPEPANPPQASRPRAHQLGVAVTYELLPGQAQVELSVRRRVQPPLPAALLAAAGLRWFF